jgi:hypothetical protein
MRLGRRLAASASIAGLLSPCTAASSFYGFLRPPPVVSFARRIHRHRPSMQGSGSGSSNGSSSSTTTTSSTNAGNDGGGVRLPTPLMFGPYEIDESQVFYSSRSSMALVNLKPLVPGHIIVLPQRVAVRFQDLRPEEATDLFLSVHEIAPRLEAHYGGQALTISIQDGAAAGQTVPVRRSVG